MGNWERHIEKSVQKPEKGGTYWEKLLKTPLNHHDIPLNPIKSPLYFANLRELCGKSECRFTAEIVEPTSMQYA
jgi:hypothetical protein